MRRPCSTKTAVRPSEAGAQLGDGVIGLCHPIVGDVIQLESDVVEHRHQQVLTVLEMAVKRGARDVGGRGDVIERNLRPALLFEQTVRGVQQPAAGIASMLAPARLQITLSCSQEQQPTCGSGWVCETERGRRYPMGVACLSASISDDNWNGIIDMLSHA